ncbi:MAG: M60 family metallopeptidase [Sedimentisphaerales bacterium]|nr:M60 family metallopeptidase [Sedimentisphaerales bacterium]
MTNTQQKIPFLILSMPLSLILMVSGMLAHSTSAAAGLEGDRQRICRQVEQIAAPGIPGPLVVWGDSAGVLVSAPLGSDDRAAVVALSRWEKGRVVAFGHTGYLDAGVLAESDTAAFWSNILTWAAGDDEPTKPVTIAVLGHDDMRRAWQAQGRRVVAADPGRLNDPDRPLDVLCLNPADLPDDAALEQVARFVRRGGGLVAAGLGWGWLQLNPGRNLTEYPGNRLLAAAGLGWADGYLQKTAPDGFLLAGDDDDLLYADRALAAVRRFERDPAVLSKGQAAQATNTLMRLARSMPPQRSSLLSELHQWERSRRPDLLPTAERPLRLDRHPLARLLIGLQWERLQGTPVADIQAHPVSASFPGVVPASAESVSRRLSISTDQPDWHSTGLYLPAGKTLIVKLPSDALDLGLSLQVGCHTDRLWQKDTWRRFPEISCRVSLSETTTRLASGFGGLVYIVVPRRCRSQVVSLEIRGAVEAAWFVRGQSGQTDPADWRERIRHYPAPWAELESDRIVLTVPARSIRELDDPEALLAFWNQVLDACSDLAGRPRQRPRPERLVTDLQISAGYMHSGYPVMTQLDVADVVVDREALRTNKHGGVWGLFHELGHNHQSADWTFAGTGEVTVNLFTLYVLEKVCHLDSQSHPSFTAATRAAKRQEYFAGGARFADWQQDPFLALDMYILLQEAFGWEPFERVFAEYRALPNRQRPRDDDQKRDQWLIRFSRTVGRDLGPYFEAWGVPTTPAARQSLADLPAWLPDGFPPAGH